MNYGVSDLVYRLKGVRDSIGQLPDLAARGATLPYSGGGRSMALPYQPVGAVGDLSPDERWIIQRESSGRTTAKNPHSTAFGLGQLIVANRRKYAARYGWSPDTIDYNQQLQMFRDYVRERYGDAQRALAFWKRNGWY